MSRPLRRMPPRRGREPPRERPSLRPLLSVVGFLPLCILKAVETFDIGIAVATGGALHQKTLELLHPIAVVSILLGFAFSRPARLTVSILFTAVQDLLVAGLYLAVWLAPSIVDGGQLQALTYIIVLEGFTLYFGVSLALALEGRGSFAVYLGLVGTSAVHGLVAWQVGHWWPLATLVLLSIPPALATRAGNGQESRLVRRFGIRAILNLTLYWTVTSFGLPALGFGSGPVEVPGWLTMVNLTGHQVIALGHFYFLALAVFEITRPPEFVERFFETEGPVRQPTRRASI